MIIPEHLEPSPLKKCMSQQMAKKVCRIGYILFMHLQLAFQRDGVHEFMMFCVKRLTTNPASPKTKLLLLRFINVVD